MLDLINKYSFLEVLHIHKSSAYLELLAEIKPQILFIDFDERQTISKSIDLLSKFTAIVYVSETKQYSFQAFEDEATDYLLFPLDIARFQKCINKILKATLKQAEREQQKKRYLNSFFIKTNIKGNKEILIQSSKILLIEAIDNQIIITMQNGTEYTTFTKLKEMEFCLPDYFMRVHKSFIINYKKVVGIQGSVITLSGKFTKTLSVGITYRKAFLERKNSLTITKLT